MFHCFCLCGGRVYQVAHTWVISKTKGIVGLKSIQTHYKSPAQSLHGAFFHATSHSRTIEIVWSSLDWVGGCVWPHIHSFWGEDHSLRISMLRSSIMVFYLDICFRGGWVCRDTTFWVFRGQCWHPYCHTWSSKSTLPFLFWLLLDYRLCRCHSHQFYPWGILWIWLLCVDTSTDRRALINPC